MKEIYYIIQEAFGGFILDKTNTDLRLEIETSQTEQISVYMLAGIKLDEAVIYSGTTTINTNTFPQGVLIVKSNKGWVRKVIK